MTSETTTPPRLSILRLPHSPVRDPRIWARLAIGLAGQHHRRRANMCSVTSQGSSYARFRRALNGGDPVLLFAAASELQRLSLADALEVVLFLRSDRRYERACLRWVCRLAEDVPGLRLTHLRVVVESFDAFRREDPAVAVDRLAEVTIALGLSDVYDRLVRWQPRAA